MNGRLGFDAPPYSPSLGRPFPMRCSISRVYVSEDDPRLSLIVLAGKNAHVPAMPSLCRAPLYRCP
eukprot:5792174-Pyramimonas_sp.AAC.1